MPILLIKLASILMFLSVALGAFGAHALKGKLDAYQLEIFKTGVLYQMIHALGLFIVAWVSTLTQDPKIWWAGILMTAGIVLFSGSLYALSLTGIRAFGPITPLGGVCLLIAWGLLIAARL